MLQRRRAPLLLALLLLCVLPACGLIRNGWAQAPAPFAFENYHRKSLHGLANVAVLIDGVGTTEEAAGISAEQIQTDVELRLRQSGVAIFERGHDKADGRCGTLFVDLLVIPASLKDLPPLVFDVHVRLGQSVMVTREALPMLGDTWETGSVHRGTGGMSVEDAVRAAVRDDVDRFLNDFLAANPKK